MVEKKERLARSRTRRNTYAALGALAALVAVAIALWEPKQQSERNAVPPVTEAAQSAAPAPAAAPPSNTNNARLYAFAHVRAQTIDDFAQVRSPKFPQWQVAPGLDVTQVATGFTYPVNLAFATLAPKEDDAPWLYVNELHGAVKYVTRAGKVETFADELLNFEPIPQPKSDESGLSGLLVLPNSHDLLLTRSYEDKEHGLLKNQILKLRSKDGGRRLESVVVLLELDEYTSPSNQIQQVAIGPDGKLYVSVGDAENPRLSLDLDKFGGKILRLNLDGSAPRDNPFYDAKAPRSPRSYVYAYGLRNVFDFDFDPVKGGLFAGDNGKDIDRFARIERGASYHWNGVRESVRLNALYTWGPAIAPCGLTFVRGRTLGDKFVNHLLLAGYGPPGELGMNHAKSLLHLQLDSARQRLQSVPEPVLRYAGEGRATVLGLAEGTDGVYFTDFFGESRAESSAGLGTIWRLFASRETFELAKHIEDPASGDPLTRGRTQFFNFCASCHTLQGVGGKEGPDLTRFGEDAVEHFNSKAYAASLRALLASDQNFVEKQKPRLLAVQGAVGRERVRTWLQHHLEEPRFDNARAKMPSMAFIAPEVRASIVEFLMSRVPEAAPHTK